MHIYPTVNNRGQTNTYGKHDCGLPHGIPRLDASGHSTFAMQTRLETQSPEERNDSCSSIHMQNKTRCAVQAQSRQFLILIGGSPCRRNPLIDTVGLHPMRTKATRTGASASP